MKKYIFVFVFLTSFLAAGEKRFDAIIICGINEKYTFINDTIPARRRLQIWDEVGGGAFAIKCEVDANQICVWEVVRNGYANGVIKKVFPKQNIIWYIIR